MVMTAGGGDDQASSSCLAAEGVCERASVR